MTEAVGGPADSERSATLWFAALLTLTNGFLDAHTYIARGHVFANVQTANVIFSAIDVSARHFSAALAHVWPLLAFVVGIGHRVRAGVGRPQLRHGADLVPGRRTDRPVPQDRRLGVPSGRHHRQPDALPGVCLRQRGAR